jgi:DHA2 family multidrug resistance protein
MLMTFLVIFSATVSIVGSQSIRGELALSDSRVVWISILYLFGTNTTVPMANRVADLYGYRRIYAMGIWIFTFGTCLAGLANDFYVFAIARYIEGIGAGFIYPVGMALIVQNVKKEKLPFGLTLYLAAAFGGGLGLGMPLSGYFSQFFSWRIPFFIILPCAIGAAIHTHFFPKDVRKMGVRFDHWGFIFFTLFIGSLLIATNTGQLSSNSEGWRSPVVIGCLVLSFLSLLATIYVERRHPQPLLPLALFKDPLFSLSCAALFLLGISVFGSLTLASSYLIEGLGTEKWVTGLICMSYGFTIFLSGLIGNVLMKYIPTSVLTIVGLSMLITSYFWNNILSLQTGYRELLPILIFRGIAVGLSLGPTTAQAMSKVTKELSSAASGMLTFFRQVGATFSGTLIVIFSIRYTIFHTARFGEQINSQLPGYKMTFINLQTLTTSDPYAELPKQAKAMIVKTVSTQAYIQSLNDTAMLFGYFILVVTCLLVIVSSYEYWKKKRLAIN